MLDCDWSMFHVVKWDGLRSCRAYKTSRAVVGSYGAKMELSYSKTAEEVLDFFRVREEVGLSGEEVAKLRKKYGHNGER